MKIADAVMIPKIVFIFCPERHSFLIVKRVIMAVMFAKIKNTAVKLKNKFMLLSVT